MQESWEEDFDDVILSRGLDYHLSDRVDIINQDESGVDAIVCGTNSYRVRIKFLDPGGYRASCTCPYADGGGDCKHVAAVLYGLDSRKSDLETGSLLAHCHTTSSLQDVISRMSVSDVRDVLLAEAKNNSRLRDYIYNFYSEKDINLASLKRVVSSIKQQHADRYGFIDYYHASDYARDMENFMERYVRSMLRCGDCETAFKLVCHIYHCLGKLDIDDSNGEITLLADTCLRYWREIVGACSLDKQWVFFDWFKKRLYDYAVDYLQCHIDDFFVDNFHEPEMLHQKLTVLDCLIAKVKTNANDQFSLHYDLERYVLARIRVMDELNISSDEIDAVCQEYYHLPGVRQFILEKLMKANEIEQAIQLLEESKQIDCKWPGLMAKASEQLMGLYQQTGQDQLYCQELEEYILNYRQDDLRYVQALKTLCSQDEWRKKRKELFSASTLCGVRGELMIQEGLYKQLLDDISKNLEQWCYNASAISTLDCYEEILSANEPEMVRDLYIDFVRKNSKYTGGRLQYQMLAKYLQKIETYPLGKELVEQIVTEWRALYPRRTAMMEELKRAGF